MNRVAQFKDDGASIAAWTPAAPVGAAVATPTAGGGALPLNKVYTYWTTYTSLAGQESPSSDGVTVGPLLFGFTLVTISSPANPGDPLRTHYNVYRAGDTLEGAFRLNTKPIALGGNFIDSFDPADSLDDYSVTQLGIALDPNASGPPLGNGLAGPYYERLLAWGVKAHLNRLYWSGTLQPYNFPGSALDEGNHVDIGELGEAIVGVTIRPRVATIYKDSSIWRCIGDPGDLNSDIERVTGEIGAIGGQAIVSRGSMDYFQGPEGLYSYDGQRVSKITGKLDCLFRGESPDDSGFAFPSAIPLNQTPAAKQRNCMAYRNGRLYFFYAGGAALSPNRGISTEIGADNWMSDSRAVSAILHEGTDAWDEAAAVPTGGGLLLASIGNDVVALEEGTTDGGAAIPLAYHSGYKDQGAPDNLKTYADVVIEHLTGGAPLTVSAFYNHGTGPAPAKLLAASEPLGTIQSLVKTVSTFQCAALTDKLGIEARNIAIRIEGGAAAVATIYKIFVHYFVEPRDAKTFDSDETDLGSERVKGIYELELDIDYPAAAGGAITWELFTDRPTGVVLLADFSTITRTAGRQILRIPINGLDAGVHLTPDTAIPVEGRLARVTLRADLDTFRLYGVRLRVRAFGEYIDSASGEDFVVFPINVGSQ